nr:MAG TPA: hypothetical protein [Caudoviricetes sp.]
MKQKTKKIEKSIDSQTNIIYNVSITNREGDKNERKTY